MKGITHASVGANAVWIPVLLGMATAPWLVVVAAFAALLPDLDASESKIKHLSVGGKIGGINVGIEPLAPVAMVTSGIFGHRGFLHSLLLIAILSICAFLFLKQSLAVVLVIIFGYTSHIIIDMLTRSGVELFWPIRTRVGLLPKFLRVKTGGIIDTILLLAGAAGVIFFLYKTAYSFIG
ncbi:MAG: metal-dependent hydrolase [Patescibacteria group bacterium]|jgi:inner membrane protein